MNLRDEMRNVQFGSYADVFKKFQTLSERYGNLSMDGLISAFSSVTGTRYEWNNPYIQN